MGIIELKIFRILFLTGIIICIWDIFNSGLQNISIWVGGILAVEIYIISIIQKNINKINSAKRVIFLLDKILEKMKSKEVSNLKDLKDNNECEPS